MQEPVTLRSLGPTVYLPSVLFFVGDGALIAIVALAARDLGASAALAGFVVALRGLGVLAFDIPAGWALTLYAPPLQTVPLPAIGVELELDEVYADSGC